MVGILSAKAQVNIPDLNFKAYLVGNSSINTNEDAEIQVSEAMAFNGIIYVPYQNITDMTGIEAFPNITQLFCDNNQITSLDLSNQTSLYLLDCYYNQITSLDVSHLNLGVLRCNNNQLTSLNLANGNNTNISTFEALNNPDLTCVEVDDVAYSTSVWGSEIDATASFSENCVNGECTVVIPDAVFESYLLGNSSINTNNDAFIQCTEAEAFTGQLVCGGLGIADLSGIEAFPNVTYIDVYGNQLTSVDVSNNTEITSLNINGNSLTSLDVSNNPLLEALFCNENDLTDLDVSNNPNLQTLYCHINALTSLDVSSCTNLSVFRSQSNSITSLNLSGNSSLQEIRCQNNQLTSLNVANGNNTNISTFQAGGNNDLTCIQVDDAAYSAANWTSIGSQTSFSENCLTVGIEENNTIQLNAYPNPFNDVLNLNLDAFSGQVGVTILDMTGRVVLTSTETNAQVQLNLSNLSVGTYALSVRGVDGKTVMSRLIKN